MNDLVLMNFFESFGNIQSQLNGFARIFIATDLPQLFSQ